MPYFICLACKARLHSAASEADPIGDLCPVCGSLLESVGDLGEIVGYRAVETRGGTWPSGASRAGRLVAGRVGEIIARGGLKHAGVRLEIEGCGADSVSPQVQAVSSRAPGAGDDAVRRRRGAPTTAASPRVPRVLRAFDEGRDRRERRRQTKVRTSSSAEVRTGAARWDRPRATNTTTPPSVALARTSRSTCLGRQAMHRREPV